VTWTVRFASKAERQADALDPPIRRRIANRLDQLSQNPRAASNVRSGPAATSSAFVWLTGG
jgi:mRNA-degrading endonuclease RelE of RelBE toxin-antitoxin system